MTSTLVIIRGNSGSGKTTIARAIQKKLGENVMLISHDVFRRDVLGVEDTLDNDSIELMKRAALYGKEIGRIVIVEGVLPTHKYKKMLENMSKEFGGRVISYYLDIPFEETVKRHVGRAYAHEFGEKEMREWWKEADHLGLPHEKTLHADMSVEEAARHIIYDIEVARHVR